MPKEVEFKIVDEQAAHELYEVNQSIDKICKKPKKSMTEEDRITLNNLLVDRAELTSKALGFKVSSLFERK